MLTHFSQWSSLPTELKIEVIKNLITSIEFPKSLINFSVTNTFSYQLGQDPEIFRYALNRFFPAGKQNFFTHYQTDPYSLFKIIFSSLNTQLKKQELNITDYFNALDNNWNAIKDKKDFILGILLALGYSIDDILLTQQVAESALILASVLGFKQQLTSLLHSKKFNQTVLCKALDNAIEAQQASTGLSLLVQVLPLLTQKAVREIFISAAHYGLSPLLSYILENKGFALDVTTKRAAVVELATNGHVDALKLLLKTCPYQMNTDTIGEGFKNAATEGHETVLLVFWELMRFKISTATLLAAIQNALSRGHEKIAITLLVQAGSAISTPMRTQLLLTSARMGQLKVAAFLLENDPLKLGRLCKGQALKLAALHHQPEMIKLLLQKAGHDIPQSDKKSILQTAAFKATGFTAEMLMPARPIEKKISQLSQALEQLNVSLEKNGQIEDTTNRYIPSFENQCKGDANLQLKPNSTLLEESFSKILSIT